MLGPLPRLYRWVVAVCALTAFVGYVARFFGESDDPEAGVAKTVQRWFGVCWAGAKPAAGVAEVYSRLSDAPNQVALTFDGEGCALEDLSGKGTLVAGAGPTGRVPGDPAAVAAQARQARSARFPAGPGEDRLRFESAVTDRPEDRSHLRLTLVRGRTACSIRVPSSRRKLRTARPDYRRTRAGVPAALLRSRRASTSSTPAGPSPWR